MLESDTPIICVPEANPRDFVTSAIAKKAGISVYLMEELTDARLRCEQLKKFVSQAIRLISKSSHRDHFYEVAGDTIYGIPDALFKLDKALAATALAASRLDYEELKTVLKPEKVTELEDVLKGVRIRQIERHSLPFTQQAEGKGSMFKAASTNRIASALRRIASEVEAASISPRDAALRLSRVKMALSQTAQEAVEAMGGIQANSREDVMKGFKSANPDLTDDQLEEIADQWEKNKDVVKNKKASSVSSEDEKRSRFEEGKPADPTENMSPEDAKKWKNMTEEHKDNFKSAASEDDRINRLVESIEKGLEQFKSAWKKYQGDPGKFKPQLENAKRDMTSISTAVRAVFRTLEGLSKTAAGRPAASSEVKDKVEEVSAKVFDFANHLTDFSAVMRDTGRALEDTQYEKKWESANKRFRKVYEEFQYDIMPLVEEVENITKRLP